MNAHRKGPAPGDALVARSEGLQEAEGPAKPAAGTPRIPPPEAITPCPNVGHRGASGYAPENTLPAYDMALQMGVDGIELDLQLTKDGVPVVFHDVTLDRIARPTAGSGPADHTGLVREKTLAQIKGCDVGSWFNEAYPWHARPEYAGLRIPTLEEVFGRYGESTNYFIEIKSPESAPGMEEELLRLLDEYGLRGQAARKRQVTIQSFSQAGLQKIHALDPSLPLTQLFRKTETGETVRPRLDAARTYAVGIGLWKIYVDAALVEEAHARHLHVHPFTVNETPEMEKLLAAGVDGMFTDFPDRLETVLNREATEARRPPGPRLTPPEAA